MKQRDTIICAQNVQEHDTVIKGNWGIIVFAVIEILVGVISFVTMLAGLLQGNPAKPLEVIIFILSTAIISTCLGVGILRYNLNAYHLLLFFSTVVILSKILIFARIISLNGALETGVPTSFNNTISIIYHCLILFYFTRKKIKQRFGEHRNVIFSITLPSLK